MTTDIVDLFYEYFEIIPATTDELKKEVFKLRYQVYCHETGFEEPEDFPDGVEVDEYDRHSVHYLIQHRQSKLYAATTRMILTDPQDPDMLFPIERYTEISNLDIAKDVARLNIAEASRFCVSKEFKKRKNEAGTETGISDSFDADTTENENRVLPHLSIGLFACLIRISVDYKIHRWYAVMEPALVRFFTTLGIKFIAIGPLADYHGKRRPYTIKVSDLLEGSFEKNKDNWDLITNRGDFLL